MGKTLLWKTIVLGLAGCVLIAGLAFAAGWYQFHAIGRQLATRALGTAHALQVYLDDERKRRLEALTNSVATNADLAAAIAQAFGIGSEGTPRVDTDAIRNLIESRRTQFGFDAVAVLDAGGKTIATAGDGFLYGRDLSTQPIVAQSRNGSTLASGVLDRDGRVYHVCAAALSRAPGLAALLVTAQQFDEASIRNATALGSTEQALIAFDAPGARVTSSTLSPDDAEALAAVVAEQQSAWLARAGSPKPEPFEIEFGGRTWYAQVEPFRPASKSTLRLSFVPPTWREPLYASIAWPLAVAAALGIATIVLGLGLYWVRTLRPLDDLERLSGRVRHGDYALHAEETGSALARHTAHTVNELLGELGRHRVPPGSPRRRSTDPP